MNSSENSGRQGAARPRWPYQLYYWDIVIAVPVARARLAGQATPRNPFLVKSDHGFLASSENAVTSHLPSMKKPQHVLQP